MRVTYTSNSYANQLQWKWKYPVSMNFFYIFVIQFGIQNDSSARNSVLHTTAEWNSSISISSRRSNFASLIFIIHCIAAGRIQNEKHHKLITTLPNGAGCSMRLRNIVKTKRYFVPQMNVCAMKHVCRSADRRKKERKKSKKFTQDNGLFLFSIYQISSSSRARVQLTLSNAVRGILCVESETGSFLLIIVFSSVEWRSHVQRCQVNTTQRR